MKFSTTPPAPFQRSALVSNGGPFHTWVKYSIGVDEVDIQESMVMSWLNRTISKYRGVYEIGTPEMVALFPWAGHA
jgi:hypothetical protein